VPIVGSFVPGSTVILSLSALIPAGDLSLTGVLAAAISGAVIGDGLAYGLGHRYPHRIRGIWPLHDYPIVVERSETFFRKYGDAAVFLARFLPPVRAFVPITAGALGMAPGRFFSDQHRGDPVPGPRTCRAGYARRRGLRPRGCIRRTLGDAHYCRHRGGRISGLGNPALDATVGGRLN
jgi:membrane-associated protein